MSANKAAGRKNESRETGGGAPHPSRWKEMRQAVRIKATLDTDERRTANARIADLCEEDRDKVAKLVRRIVEVSAIHDQNDQEFHRQRAIMESEIQELRGFVKRDTLEIDELSDKLKAALAKVRDYQERVLVLEESNELEVRHRMATDQTVDLLKLEVDKLRKLVKRQRLEMDAKESGQQRSHQEAMAHMAQELQHTHEQLLQERRDRLEEKERELKDRIERTAAASATDVKALTNKYDSSSPEETNGKDFVEACGRAATPMDMLSFLNTSTELPDKIKELMNEWKSRMEDALNTTAASIAQSKLASPPRVVSTGIQTDEEEETFASSQRETAMSRRTYQSSPRHTQREAFDRMLVDETHRSESRHGGRQRSMQLSASPVSRALSSARNNVTHSTQTQEYPDGSSLHHDRSVKRALLDDFANASVLVDDDSFEDEVESTIALLIDGFHSPLTNQTPPRNELPAPRRKLSLYDSSMLDVVDAIESDATNSERVPYQAPRYYREEDSPTLRVERLLEGLQIREQRLARVGSRPISTTDEPSFLQDVELFNEVKDVYAEHLEEGRRDGFQPKFDEEAKRYEDDDASVNSDPLSASHSSRCLSVQEAIEKDMKELLRHERFLALTR